MTPPFLMALLCLPLARAQSLDSDFEALKKRRDEAIQEAAAPIERKFKENANQLLAKAIQTGQLDTAEKIKREIVAAESKNKICGIRKTLLMYSWKMGDLIYNFEEDGSFKAGAYSATYIIEANGTISTTWDKGVKSTLTPMNGFASLQEKGGGNNTFTKISKVSKPASSLAPDSTFGRRTN